MIYLFRCTKDLEISPRKQSKDMLARVLCMYKTHENINFPVGNTVFHMHVLCFFVLISLEMIQYTVLCKMIKCLLEKNLVAFWFKLKCHEFFDFIGYSGLHLAPDHLRRAISN